MGNEAYRGKEYCIIYGWSAFDYSRTALVKKNVCDSTQDKVRYIENQYASEMYFIANPEGSSEDDGVLVSVHFDGPKEQSTFLFWMPKRLKKSIDLIFPTTSHFHYPMECTFLKQHGLYRPCNTKKIFIFDKNCQFR